MKDASLFEVLPASSAESLQPLSGENLVQALAPTSPALSLSRAAAESPPADPDEALVGTVLGSFRIVRKLAHGGMGTVYLAQQAAIGSQVAVKFMHPHLAEDPRLVARFYAEARAVNLIGHENVVSIFDVGVLPPASHYLMMEYLDGRPLSAFTMPLAPRLWVPILVQVCDALAAAHRHDIVHRDLKPENIFLIRRGGNEHFVKLLDFGVARLGPAAARAGAPTSTGLILGTPEYMAPEQSLSARVDGRSDLYSLGVIAFQLATGRLPFHGGPNELLAAHRDKAPPHPRELNPELSEALGEIILCALAKRPEDRYQTAESFKVALLDAVGDKRAAMVAKQREVELEGQFKDAAGKDLGRLRCIQLSRGGLFACTTGALPPLFSRLTISLPIEGAERVCVGDVVRHVRPAEAGAWGMPAGFGVQFADTTPAFKDTVSRLLQGLPKAAAAPEAADDATAARALAELAGREWGEPYALLAIERDASMADVRLRGREERRKLEALRDRPLSTAQREKLSRFLERLAWAASILGQPIKRAWHDAGIGNYPGVARCITGGLGVPELEALRARFLAEHRGAEARATVLAVTARSFEAQGKDDQALEQYERALALDPLNLELHKGYSALRRRAAETRRHEASSMLIRARGAGG